MKRSLLVLYLLFLLIPINYVFSIGGDFNQDGCVNFDDFFLFAEQYGKKIDENSEYFDLDSKFDLDYNKKIDIEDFFIFADFYFGICEMKNTKMVGSKKLLIVEFIQKNLEFGHKVEGYNLIDFLNNPNESVYLDTPYGYEVYSLNSIDRWFESEAKTYDINLSIDIDIKGPFEVDFDPPKRGFYDSCTILDNYFNKELKKHNIKPSIYDSTSILFFQNGNQIFWSCPSYNTRYNYINIDWVEMLNVHTTDIVQTTMHEIMHLFGATDKYSGRLCVIPYGIPEPEKRPLYPQDKACIMCGQIMKVENSVQTPDNLKQLVVCNKTAQEIGWGF